MKTAYAPKMRDAMTIGTESRFGVCFYYIEGEGFSEAHANALADTLAKYAVHAMMRDEWARVVVVTDQHDGGIGISIGNGLPLPVMEICRILPSWDANRARSAIRDAMRTVAIYRNTH